MKARTRTEQIAHFHAGCVVNENTPDKCLEWQWGTDRYGYGKFWYQGNTVQTHRLSYELFHGRQIAEDMCICHSCDTPKCCKPEHLREGTNQENTDDMTSRNRQANGETNGRAKLTANQVLEIREKYETLENCTQSALANEFGVTRQTISHIIHNKTWTHI